MEIRHSCWLKVIRLLGFDRIDGRKQGNLWGEAYDLF